MSTILVPLRLAVSEQLVNAVTQQWRVDPEVVERPIDRAVFCVGDSEEQMAAVQGCLVPCCPLDCTLERRLHRTLRSVRAARSATGREGCGDRVVVGDDTDRTQRFVVLHNDRRAKLGTIDIERAQRAGRDVVEVERREQEMLGARMLDAVIAGDALGRREQCVHRGEIGSRPTQLVEHVVPFDISWPDA
jgi:hypothetical protein